MGSQGVRGGRGILEEEKPVGAYGRGVGGCVRRLRQMLLPEIHSRTGQEGKAVLYESGM